MRKSVHALLSRLTTGHVIVHEGGTSHAFGPADAALRAEVFVKDTRFYKACVLGGTMGFGESYVEGWFASEHLTELVRIFAADSSVIRAMDSGWTKLLTPLRRAGHWLLRNTRKGSKRNIAAHYDLGNDFFATFLDPTMLYSCAVFEKPEMTLEEASRAKIDRLCRKLQLKPSDHLLEIGSGWGAMALHAAKHYGCRVTTTTISREQHDFARDKIAARGLSDRITLLFEDYRDLKGRFDKLLSIEMIEAVGARYLDTYFSKCSSLLQPNGAMLLQAITLQDQMYAQALKSVDFIQRYVFPGSFIPSVTAITDSLTRVTDLKVFNLEDIGPHYARTLRLWRERFFANIEQVRKLGYPESFSRLWDFYLCYCEGGYAERQLGNVQMLLTKPACRRAPILAT
jgi:cyclopropane-fatty-acyl-phospholipid synthase